MKRATVWLAAGTCERDRLPVGFKEKNSKISTRFQALRNLSDDL